MTHIQTMPRVRKTYMKPRIVTFIPAHNEERSIRDCLEGLADQTLPANIELDVIVIADNCNDHTIDIAEQTGNELSMNLKVVKTSDNKQRKVGALNTAWKQIYGDPMDLFQNELSNEQIYYRDSVKAILGMDADSRLAPNALLHLWEDLMSARNIGGVMAKYTMRMPKKKKLLSKDDVHFEEEMQSGKYGGPIARWWTHQQKQDMASWILNLQYHGGSTYVLGGQATLFRPDALQEVVQQNKLDGPWQNESDVEDMLLTWQLQKSHWKTLIAREARCFVDAMKTYHTFRQQRNKWIAGTVDLLTNRDIQVHSKFKGKLWRAQLKAGMEIFIRVFFILLLAVALATDQFYWSWIWAIPIVLASILNVILTLKTPMHRLIDVVFAFLLISPEIYLWTLLITHCQVWLEKFSVHKKDGWANQYQAEGGKTRSKLMEGLIITVLILSIIVFLCIHYRSYLTSLAFQQIIQPYLMSGWIVLSCLTIFSSVFMLYQIWTLRGNHRA